MCSKDVLAKVLFIFCQMASNVLTKTSCTNMWWIKICADVKVNICGLLRDLFWTVFIDTIVASSFVCAGACVSVCVHVFGQ